MQKLSDNERERVFREVVADELRVIHEYVKGMPEMKRSLTAIEADIKEIKANMQFVKAVLADR